MRKLLDKCLTTIAIIMLCWVLWELFTTDCDNQGMTTQLPGECK